MFEMILNPRRAKARPWEMFFVGLLYSSLSVLLVYFVFSGDYVLVKYSAILIVTFVVMFSTPYIYHTIKMEEQEENNIEGIKLIKEYGKVLHAFTWLFMGFIVGFSVLFLILGSSYNYQAQVETYCSINSPSNYESCTRGYGVVTGEVTGEVTGNSVKLSRLGGIFTNNIYVLIFSIIFSLIFGAGGIFILAWNASVIATAMIIFSKQSIYTIPLSLARYMIHGIPEIGAYFLGTLAGGIIGISLIRKDFKSERFWDTLHNALILVILGIVILGIAALIEVYITPKLF
jgi:uncharacterized membrane protein SpoIIM required for sporulation